MFETSSQKSSLYKEEYKEYLSALFAARIDLVCKIGCVLFAINSLLYIFSGYSLWGGLLRLSLVGFYLIVFVANLRSANFKRKKVLAYILSFGIIGIIAFQNYYSEYFFTLGIAPHIIAFFTLSFLFPWRVRDVCIFCLWMIICFTSVGSMRGYENYIPYVVLSFFSMATSCIIIGFVTYFDNKRRFEAFFLQKEIEKNNEQINRELQLARDIHKNLLPVPFSTQTADLDICFQPMRYIGGDYGKVHIIAPGKIFCLISDITGHGVPAALLVNRLHIEVERLIASESDPAGVLKKLDQFVKKEFEGTGTYLSAFACLVDMKEESLVYCGYGHPYQFVFRPAEEKLIPMLSSESLLGLPIEEGIAKTETISLLKGDKIILFTDGITETKDSERKDYGYRRLESFIRQNGALRPAEFSARLLDELEGFRSGDINDDILLMTLEIKI